MSWLWRVQKPKSPIIPANPKDRTGTGKLVAKALRDINSRFENLGAAVVSAFLRIPRYELNDAAGQVIRYAMTPAQLSQVAAEIQEAVIRWIAEGKSLDGMFWWDSYIDEATQTGIAQSVANLSALSASYAATTTVQSVLSQPIYTERLGVAKFKSYEHWTGLSAQLKSELSSIIGRAVTDGKNPRDVTREISERLEVSKAKAAQYAQTDITDTLRQTRWAETDRVGADLGIKVALLWTSALKATTRETHAAKHGRAYTTSEVREFYGRDGNRYNCYCSQIECLIDAKGKPLLPDSRRISLTQERGAWQLADGKRRAGSS